MGYAQSSVTAQIQALEEDVGVPLFDRIGRRVELTQAGQKMVGYADRILALTEEARAVVGSDREPSGPLTIGAPETLLTHRLPNVISRFQETFPRVDISVIATENCELAAGQLRLSSSIDIAFILNRRYRSENIMVECLSVEDILVLVSAGHRLAAATRFSVDMLQDEQILLTERNCGYRVLFEEAVSQAGGCLNKTLELPSIEAIKRCAASGMGIAVLPRIAVAKEVEHRQLLPLPWPKEPIRVYSQMIRHSERWQSPALVAFWQLAKQILATKVAGKREL